MFGAFSLTPTLEGNQSTRPEIGATRWHGHRTLGGSLTCGSERHAGGPFTGSGQSMALRQLAALTRSMNWT